MKRCRPMLFCLSLALMAGALRAQNAPAGETGGGKTESPGKKDAPGVPSVKPLDYDPGTYIIGADDQLMISVWREPELSLSVVVRPDGMITLPLLNDVRAAGLKPLELQAQLSEKFKNFVNEPQVTVIVQGIRSRRVFLTGPGAKPGAFSLIGKMSVLELLVQAGGVGPFAKTNRIYVLRMVNGQQIRIPFDYKKAIAGKSAGVEVYLEPNDVVVVP